MDVFRRLLDFLTLGSERPIRRLLAYYVVLGVVVAALFHFVPLLNDLVSGTHLEKLTGSSNLLEDGLAGLSAPVPTQAETTIDLILTTMIVMISALVLMLPVAWVFMSARNVRSFDQGVVQTLIILPLVVAGIVLVVRTSLALAFSLGAIVAGIRFRTNVRDVRDTVYIFLGIGVGLAVGVQSLVVAAMLSITFNFVVLFIWRYDFGRSVLEPTASSQWAQPLENLSERESEHSVPDRDLVLALSPRRAAELAKRFDRVQRILGPAKKGPRFNSILSVTTTSMGEAQNRIESVLNTYARRWRLDQVTTTEGKPGELYYLVGMRRSVTRDALMTAIREVAGDKIVSANLEMSDAVGQEKGQDKAVEKAQEKAAAS